MGLNINHVKFLLNAKMRGVPFNRVLMIGRQSLAITPDDIKKLLKLPIDEKLKKDILQLRLGSDMYAEELFYILGAQNVDSMDKTSYEGATINHDLNLPVPEELKEKYDIVLDGGSLEHIFNFPVAIKQCMEMLKINGHYFGMTPFNNFAGHGFYQFSPELFLSIFSSENGFEILDIILYEEDGVNSWYKILNPKTCYRGITFQNKVPTLLLILAEKKEAKAIFSIYPQQQIYQEAWSSESKQILMQDNQSLKQFVFKWLSRLPSRVFRLVLNTYLIARRFRKDIFIKVD
jgi:hypothetical protein